MAHSFKLDYLSFEDYLAGEQDAEVRSEYIEGQVYAMAGGSELHNTVASEFHTIVNSQLPDECRAWQSDMKVIGKKDGKHFAYYPIGIYTNRRTVFLRPSHCSGE